MIYTRTVNKDYSREWDLFVDSSNSGTIFHKQKFLGYHPSGKFNTQNLVFKKNNKTVGLISGNVKNGVFVSPAGASYGSFVVNNLEFQVYEEIIDSLVQYCKNHKIQQIVLTPPPVFYLTKQNEIEKFLLEYKGFHIQKSLISNALHIGDIKKTDEIMGYFSNMHKRAVMKSFKNNVYVKKSNDYDTFYKILLENKKKFNVLPTHTFDEITYLQKLFPKDIVLLMAYSHDHKPLGGIWVIKTNHNVGLAFYICHYYEYQELRAVNRLFYELILWGKKEKLNWIDLGVSMDTTSENPMEPSRSLIYFKEGIGTRGFLRTSYVLNLNKK